VGDHPDGPRGVAALSAHPDPAVAVGEAVGSVLERSEPHPEFAVLLVSGTSASRLDDVVAATRALLAPEVLIGSTVDAVSAGADFVSDGVAILAVSDLPGPVRPVRVAADGRSVTGWPAEIEPGSSLLALAGDRFPVTALRSEHGCAPIGSSVVAMPSGRGVGRRFALIDDDGLHHSGAVGVVVSPRVGRFVGFEVGLWDEDDPVPEPPIDPTGGVGAFAVFGHRAAAVPELSIDLEVLSDSLPGAVLGMVGRQTASFRSGAAAGGFASPDFVSGMIFGRYRGL
jgi:hypothetical protein